MNDDTSALDVVVLVVLANAFGIWSFPMGVYNAAPEMTPERLIRFEQVSASVTVLFGVAASFLTRKASPAIAAIAFSLVMIWLYDYEYAKAHPEIYGGEVE